MARSPMWAWLEQEGYLSGDQELLAKGKEAWKKKYHRDYQRARRGQKRHVAVVLHGEEEKELKKSAKQYQRPLTTYIREASLAYSRQHILFPNEHQILELREEIAMIRYSLEDIHRSLRQAKYEEHAELVDLLVDRISYLDAHVKTVIASPLVQASQSENHAG